MVAMRSLVLLFACLTLVTSPAMGLGSAPGAALVHGETSAPSRWVAWYEQATGLPAPAVLSVLTTTLDDLFPSQPRDEDSTPEVHVGWMVNYCNTVLHDDCVYNDPTGHSYNCGPNHIDVNQGLTIWDSDPGVVLMNYTIYDTYTEGWLGLGWGGVARHVVLIGTNCHGSLFNSTYVNTSGIGFYFPM